MSSDYPPQAGTWTLTAPDGRIWQGPTPLDAVRSEMNERIPADVQLARIFAACDEPDEDTTDGKQQA